ncbi:E3 ubiquitin ligase BIG BROTHER-like [Asparagus officinalis]|uniref:E3 ubiquitin ligase BIG BROTHER-like n=1 Tax=Asparagus officinalis TaxID=4686 RepID=UPI00098E2EEF|nr:E3 ubiquitin ligase BIG BROTHER-like [Asparagus officinalis]XP_020241668.1 E3 ubiquitin ligase BIG BROTHER-like [Asparagus officinalis]XP_020241669.1 E3 ubiquitin ligase BIG BROTHER-like [Asparagus officinalis]XP_020241670.1 E3 ubiquitin ligase BIG BROTHER-like [Asparagus officinalis]XP_020241671.1 E3 ubiquitin ligase BIG BROTHER-like [Asparagus officinalis]XP_020241672.1 E3 ubiquitin ligase BIG BROTHER-like [Asparagus officinalis]
MNANRQVEVHYIDTGFPYTVTQSFMDLFEGLSYAQADVALVEALQDQGNPYWSMMHTSSYKYGYSGSGNNPYYSFSNSYEINDYVPRLDGGRRVWDDSAPSNIVDSPQIAVHGAEDVDTNSNPSTEECIRTNNSGSPEQVIWQDNIDPDNMTYEELLDLGEAVGTQSRGLSQDKISLLPVTKYKCGFFSRKKSRRERCVICQMDYKRGDRQMTLPCRHVYHSSCVSRWLGINKACPVCFTEVFGEEPTQQ